MGLFFIVTFLVLTSAWLGARYHKEINGWIDKIIRRSSGSDFEEWLETRKHQFDTMEQAAAAWAKEKYGNKRPDNLHD